jgi:hypothetical protein
MSYTYAELKNVVQDFTQNDETSFVANLPLFIQLAEERILKNVQLDLFRKNATANMISGNKYVALPPDFLAPFSFSLVKDGAKEFLELKDVSFIQTYNPDGSVTGLPLYYSVFDVDNMIVAPTPDAGYSVEMHYYYRPDSLTAGAEDGTTWLSTNATVALLYGTLVEAYTYMKGEADVMQNYTQRFVDAVQSLKMLGESKEVSQEYRVGRVMRPKQ